VGELVIKGPARLTALAKPCSLLGRDSDFIGSRMEETAEFSKVFVKMRENCVILEWSIYKLLQIRILYKTVYGR
jgi:hypothetical protein